MCVYLLFWIWPAIVGQAMIVCMNPLSWVPCWSEDHDLQASHTTTSDRRL